jgi:hypothetical protein
MFVIRLIFGNNLSSKTPYLLAKKERGRIKLLIFIRSLEAVFL